MINIFKINIKIFNEKLENIKKYVIKNKKNINAKIENIKNNNFKTKPTI